MSFEIGQNVAGYEIAGTIGAGGMGTVYRVRNPITDRVDAMKVLLPDLSKSDDLAGRFLREIKIHASLRHPNIAALYTAMQFENQILMVMEYVEGISLEQRLTYGTLGIGEAMDYMHQALSALSYAHDHGVVHRDIKPSNIMITAEGRVKLLDFGIARGPSDLRLTQKGIVIGSLLYMAPEQILGGDVDARSDLYAAGVTLYQMVTGRRPFDGTNEYAIMRAHTEGVPVAPCEVSQAVEPNLSRAIMKALEKNPAARFQSAVEFSSALDAFRMGVRRTETQPAPVQATAPASPFPAAALETLEHLLAPYAGPIARHMVRKKSLEVSSLNDLCEALAGQLNSTTERELFRQAGRRELGLTAPSPAAITPVPVQQKTQAWDPAVLDEIRRVLAASIGPVAKVLVERSSKKAHSVQELCQILSQEIPSPKDREAFLARSFQAGPKQ